MTSIDKVWHDSGLVRHLRARPRLYIATLFAIAVGILLPMEIASHSVTRSLIAWNAGTDFYVLLAVVMMTRSTQDTCATERSFRTKASA